MKYFIVISAAICLLFLAGCKTESGVKTEIAPQTDSTAMRKSFCFVGNVAAQAALLSYTFSNDGIDTVWYNPKESIALYNASSAGDAGFFITVTESAKKGVFPSVKNITLYFIDHKNNQVTKSKNFGNGVEFFAFWQDSSTVKLILNILDPTTTSYVEQRSIIVGLDGRVLFEDKKKYDMVKDGYPRIPQVPLQLTSSINGASIQVEKDNQIFVRPRNSKKQELENAENYLLRQVEWSVDGKFAIIVTAFINPSNTTLYDKEPQTSNLYIFDLENNNVAYTIKGSGYKNCLQINGLILFDYGFGESAEIKIINPAEPKKIRKITIQGGCGLNSIPRIPDYEA